MPAKSTTSTKTSKLTYSESDSEEYSSSQSTEYESSGCSTSSESTECDTSESSGSGESTECESNECDLGLVSNCDNPNEITVLGLVSNADAKKFIEDLKAATKESDPVDPESIKLNERMQKLINEILSIEKKINSKPDPIQKITINNIYTKAGLKNAYKAYKLMVSMGMITRPHSITINDNGKKVNIFKYELYEWDDPKHKKNKLSIYKLPSKFNQYKNGLHIMTGILHGGYIGIDIDVKNISGASTDRIYNYMLIKSGVINNTLTCVTPSGGYHYVYKLTDQQRLRLMFWTGKSQLELFGCDIDVIFNGGRFVMHGSYMCNDQQKSYIITNKSKPMDLPDVVFKEIVSKIPHEAMTKNPFYIDQKLTKDKCHTCIHCKYVFYTDFGEYDKWTIGEKKFLCSYCIGQLEDNSDLKTTYRALEFDSTKQDVIKKSKNHRQPVINIKINFDESEYTEVDKYMKILLDKLNPLRCSDYQKWFNVGAIIYNVSGNFTLFDNWSKQCEEKYDLNGCKKTWCDYACYSGNRPTINKLKNLVLEDNPELTKSINPHTIWKDFFSENLPHVRPMYTNRQTMLDENRNEKFYISFVNNTGTTIYTYLDNHADVFTRNLNVKGKHYIAEIIPEKIHRKPYLVVERTYDDETTFMIQVEDFITKLQQDIIKVFQQEYNEIITPEDIRIINKSGNTPNGYQLSLHIIISPVNRTLYYIDNKYTDSSVYHFYSSMTKLDSVYVGILNGTIYGKLTKLNIIGSHETSGSLERLSPFSHKFQPIDLATLTDTDKSHYFVTHLLDNSRKLHTPLQDQYVHNNSPMSFDNPSTNNFMEQMKEMVKKVYHDAEYVSDYKSEKRQCTYYNFKCTSNKQECPISHRMHTEPNMFYTFYSDRGLYMKCHGCKGCVNEKGDDFINLGVMDPADEFIKDAYQINQQYLTDNDVPLSADKKNLPKVERKILKWLQKPEYKTLAIKSPMSTGKTTAVQKILDYMKQFKKILWISHRQALSKQIYGSFKDLGFVNYMDVQGPMDEYDKVIIQIDSLHRITKSINGDIIFNVYDLVIIDEIEGALHHFTSPHLDNAKSCSRDTFELMTTIIANSGKLLVMDADMAMRTKFFIDSFGKYIMINNQYRPVKRKFIITKNRAKFEKQIFDDIKNGKNICIVSMSSSRLEELASVFEANKIKYIMHTSNTDDRLKDLLSDVNTNWKDIPVIMYSPTIESGVDFNIPQVYRMYGILKNGDNTCSQRAFLQMCGRIRQLEELDILCHYEGSTNLVMPLYVFDDLMRYFRIYESISGRKIIRNAEYDTKIVDGKVIITRKNDFKLYEIISIYNEVENSNKNPAVFMTVLNIFIQRAGHELVIDEEEVTAEDRKGIVGTSKAEALAEINEANYKLKDLKAKQFNGLFADEKLAREKILFMIKFGLTNSADKQEFIEFHKEFANKVSVLDNFVKLMNLMYVNEPNIDDIEFDSVVREDKPIVKTAEDEELIAESRDVKEEIKLKIVIDLLNRLTGKNLNKYTIGDLPEIKITGAKFCEVLEDIKKNSIYFSNENAYRALFTQSKLSNYANRNVAGSKTQKKRVVKKKGAPVKRAVKGSVKGGPVKKVPVKDTPVNGNNKPVKRVATANKKIADINKHYIVTIKNVLRTFGIQLVSGKKERSNGGRHKAYILCLNENIKNIAKFKYEGINNINFCATLFAPKNKYSVNSK